MRMKRILAAILAVATAISMSGCGGNEVLDTDNKEGKGTVRWYMPVSELTDTPEVHKLAQDYIEEKIGVKTELLAVNMGDYESKLQMINASREEYDLSFVSNWMNFYINNVRRGSLLDITELLPQYAPETYKNIPEMYWDGVKVNGKIYAAINQQIMSRGPCFYVPTKNLEIIDFDFEPYKGDLVGMFEYYAKKIYEYSKEPIPNTVWQPAYFGFDEFLAVGLPAVIDINADGVKVINQYESEAFKNMVKKSREWYLAGYIPQNSEHTVDVNGWLEANDSTKVLASGGLHPTYKPGLEAEHKNSMNYDITIIEKTQGVATTAGSTSTMTGVSATSDSPENALKVIEMINNDKYLFNLLAHGIEGKHYTKTGENRIKPNVDNNYVIQEWAIGNIYNGYLLPGTEDNLWEETDRINRESKVSPALGLNIDIEPIKVEYQNCNSVVTEYLSRLIGGYGDADATYAEFMDKLKAAGVDKLVKECQAQADEWVKTKQ